MISSKVRLQLVNCRDLLFWANSALGRKARVVEVLCSAPPVAFAFLLHEIRFQTQSGAHLPFLSSQRPPMLG